MIELNLKVFDDLLRIEKERNLQMLAVSRLLRVDFTFSEEEILENAEQQLVKHMEKQISERFEKMLKGVK